MAKFIATQYSHYNVFAWVKQHSAMMVMPNDKAVVFFGEIFDHAIFYVFSISAIMNFAAK